MAEANKMITFMNNGGAVHTVPEELFLNEYKGKVRKLTKAQLDKMGKLSAEISIQAGLRASAVLENGQPDNEARSTAARAQQKATAAANEYKAELMGEE